MIKPSSPFTITFLLLCLACNSAKKAQSDLNFALQDLQVLAARISSMDPFTHDYEEIDSLEWKLFMGVASILQDPFFPKEKLDDIPMPQVKSYDGRIRVFNQFINTGGSWREYRTLFFVDRGKKPAEIFVHFPFASGAIDHLYLLPGSDKSLYLGLSGTQTCTTCYSGSAFLVDLSADSVQMEPILEIECRGPDLDFFRYDPGRRTLEYQYALMPDDLYELPEEYDTINADGFPVYSDTLRWEMGEFRTVNPANQ